MLKISIVDRFCIAEELGIKPGYSVVDFDGNPARDLIDYVYYDAQESFTLGIQDNKGKYTVYEIDKDDDETLGLSFVDDGLAIKTCHNNCIFCFVQQMPEGLRETLYVKDDDYRQSFLCGNFVTLTNLTESDEERIVRYGL